MADFKWSHDWFYSFRWVPARFFRNRILSQGSSPSLEATYRAHSELSPQTHEHLRDLRPAEYRRRYAAIMAEVLPENWATDSRKPYVPRTERLRDIKLRELLI